MRLADTPLHRVSRVESFGPGGSLHYNIIVNWVIAEHESQIHEDCTNQTSPSKL
jgi:hypothetical protein